MVARNPINDLTRMATFMRPHSSATEERFIKEWLVPLGLKQDSCGNLYKWVGTSPVCWASHVDTVHRSGGQQLIQREGNLLKLSKVSQSNCLGGDDTCGVWLMREMIKAGKPGLYLFHRGEEKGCIGSGFIAKKNPKALEGIKAVISLDRRGTKSVITFQRGSRCCSDVFGKSLASVIGMNHDNDPTGLYTDSANYTCLVGECTNLSVGYDGEHSSTESIDVGYLMELRARLIEADVTKLEYSRKPGEHESRWKNTYSEWGGGYGSGDYYSSYCRKIGLDYKSSYRGGYWDSTEKKWIALSKSEWEIWRIGGARFVKINSGDTSADAARSIWTPMEVYILENVSMVARMMQDSWGFDLTLLRECLDHHKAEDKMRVESSATNVEDYAQKDEKRLSLPAPCPKPTGHEGKADA